MNPNIPNPNAGVVDYFAILGIGEKFVPKHATTTHTVNGVDSIHDLTSSDEISEEEEAQMIERFYREIVELRIFSNWDKNPKQPHFRSNDFNHMHNNDHSMENHDVDDEDHVMSARRVYESPPKGSLSTNNTAEGFTILSHSLPAGLPSTSSIYSSHSDLESYQNNTKPIWNIGRIFQANLNPYHGLRSEIQFNLKISQSSKTLDSKSGSHQNLATPSSALKLKKASLLFREIKSKPNILSPLSESSCDSSLYDTPSYHIGYRRRGADEGDKSAIANVELMYVRIPSQKQYWGTEKEHQNDPSTTVGVLDQIASSSELERTKRVGTALKRGLATGAGIAARAGLGLFQRNSMNEEEHSPQKYFTNNSENSMDREFPSSSSISNDRLKVPLLELLDVPEGYNELIVPDDYQYVNIPSPKIYSQNDIDDKIRTTGKEDSQQTSEEREARRSQRRLKRTFLFPSLNATTPSNNDSTNPAYTAEQVPDGEGIEAFVDGSSFLRSPSTSPDKLIRPLDPNSLLDKDTIIRNHCLSSIQFPLSIQEVNGLSPPLSETGYLSRRMNNDNLEVIPVLAVRYQQIGDEERFHEDPAITDLAVSFLDKLGRIVMPSYPHMEEDGDDDEEECIRLVAFCKCKEIVDLN